MIIDEEEESFPVRGPAGAATEAEMRVFDQEKLTSHSAGGGDRPERNPLLPVIVLGIKVSAIAAPSRARWLLPSGKSVIEERDRRPRVRGNRKNSPAALQLHGELPAVRRPIRKSHVARAKDRLFPLSVGSAPNCVHGLIPCAGGVGECTAIW